jgi:hypothetical protein
MPTQYYVTAEIKPNGDIEVIRIEGDYGVLEHAHRSARDHVMFLRSVGQRHEPHGKLETKPLLRALAAWPLVVLKTIVSMRYGTMGQETDDMPRGLRLIADADGLDHEQSSRLIAAVNRCALNEATDNDRVLLARKNEDGDRMLGPCELVECDKHPGHHKLHRWTWHVPEDGDHLSAIECGDVGSVSACPMCLQAEIEAVQPSSMGLKVKMVDGRAVLDGNGRTRVKAAIAANRVPRAATKRPTWCELAAVILRHVPTSLECGAIERSPEDGHWLRLTTSDEYDFVVDIDWRAGVLSMAEIDEGGEVLEAMKTRRAKTEESAIGPTIAGWLKEFVAELDAEDDT